MRTLLYIVLNILILSSISNAEVIVDNILLPDGVKRFHLVDKNHNRPSFFVFFENFHNAVFKKKPPFNKTVAFLAGVSQYNNFHDLPLVDNDLIQLRNFLLTKGGVDTVYVAKNEVVSTELIRRYMLEYFPTTLNQEDRLIFYYSGHADNNQGNTGYMQFMKATPGVFWRDVIPITDTLEWSKVNVAKHMLFIYDCCSSGLAFDSKGEKPDTYEKVIEVLSGEGSRIVITAGTKGQKTYDGWFTKALLQGLSSNKEDHFLTVHDIYSTIQKEIARKASSNDKTITPKLWELENYIGTFIFNNPNRIDRPFTKVESAFVVAKSSISNLEANSAMLKENILNRITQGHGKTNIVVINSIISKPKVQPWIIEYFSEEIKTVLSKESTIIPIYYNDLAVIFSDKLDISFPTQIDIDDMIKLTNQFKMNIIIIDGSIESIEETTSTLGNQFSYVTNIQGVINCFDVKYGIRNQQHYEVNSFAENKIISKLDALSEIVFTIEDILLPFHPAASVRVAQKNISDVWIEAGSENGVNNGDYYYIFNPQKEKPISLIRVFNTNKNNSNAKSLHGHRLIKEDFIAKKDLRPKLSRGYVSLEYLALPLIINSNIDQFAQAPNVENFCMISYIHTLENNGKLFIIKDDDSYKYQFNIGIGSTYGNKLFRNKQFDKILQGSIIDLGIGLRKDLLPGYFQFEGKVGAGLASFSQTLPEISKSMIINEGYTFDSNKATSSALFFKVYTGIHFFLDKRNIFAFHIGVGFVFSNTADRWDVSIKDGGDKSILESDENTFSINSNYLSFPSVQLKGTTFNSGISIKVPFL